jgi:hypothetical protein
MIESLGVPLFLYDLDNYFHSKTLKNSLYCSAMDTIARDSANILKTLAQKDAIVKNRADETIKWDSKTAKRTKSRRQEAIKNGEMYPIEDIADSA